MDFQDLKREQPFNTRYERQLQRITRAGKETDRISGVVEEAIQNLGKGHTSFVIYGEPQSGKTEMMICLTAKLLDVGRRIVIVLLNDSVQLLDQNLERFQRSAIDPAPQKFSEILPPYVEIGNHQWIIFCKKNAKDLQKLLDKVRRQPDRVIIDDEADYATPNSKINLQEQSRINELTGELIGDHGVFIGVTATPARLDLNRTHGNQQEAWIDFPPHSAYCGHEDFFPVDIATLQYRLTFLPEEGDDPKHMREAIFRFMVNVAYLNTAINSEEQNYSILIHTSSKTADHAVDYEQVVKVFEALRTETNPRHEAYYTRIFELGEKYYPGHGKELTGYILRNRDRRNIVVMNSDKEINAANNRTATNPSTPFTVVIGGNLVSRGVTFDSLLAMFFTRDVKHKLQQDTYIQRARMFGSRKAYLKFFELAIPRELYLSWQTCFIFHRLSLEARKATHEAPAWMDGERITAVSPSSIDKTSVIIAKGEMGFGLFQYDEAGLQNLIGSTASSLAKVKDMHSQLGDLCLPAYIVRFIESFCPSDDASIAVHMPNSVAGYTETDGTDIENITRTKGFVGKSQLEESKFPSAVHHVFVFHNGRGKARVIYKYSGNVRFLRIRPSQ